MIKPKIECIYLDMDGVIADFVKRYKELYKMEPRDAEKKKEFNKYFDEFIETKQFETLEMMPQAEQLIDFLKSIDIPTKILSSTASQARYDAIAPQKEKWLDEHDIHFERIFVPGKDRKSTRLNSSHT